MSSQKPQVFPAGPEAKTSITRLAYRYFVGGAGLLIMGVIALAVSIASQMTLPVYLVGLFSAISCAGAAGLVIAVMTLFRLRQPVQVEVTPYRLTWREGPRVATLEYNEVERVDLVRDKIPARGGGEINFPVVRFIEDDGEMMEFEVSFDDEGTIRHGRFDAHAITQAVLPYVKDHAVISAAVDEFVRTGFVDIDGLAQRR
jgi:hypothetical protein